MASAGSCLLMLASSAEQVEPGQVPAAVLRQQREFYRCGRCQQIFWPGEKYESTMEGLRAEGKEVAVEAASKVGTAGGVWKAPANDVQPGDMRIGDVKVATSMWFREKKE